MQKFEILEQKSITYEEFKQIQQYVKNLPEMENCKGKLVIECRKIAEIQWNEKTKIIYYIKLTSHEEDEDYEFLIVKKIITS